MTNKSTMLLEHNLKQLKLPTFLREYDKLASQCASEGADHPDYLLRLSELELIDRHHRMVERRIKAARFPTTKSLDTFDFLSMPSLNKALVLELARCEYIERPHNVIALGNSGTGKTHIALGLGLAACQRGLSVGFTTAAALVHQLIEARDERRLLNLQRRLARLKLLIIDELGFVPLSKTGAELLFEVFSQRYERGSVLYQALETKQLPIEVLSPRILSLKSRQDQLTAARDEAEGQLEQRRADLPTSKEIKGYVADFREFLQEGTFPERKALIRNFVQSIEIENRGLSIPAL